MSKRFRAPALVWRLYYFARNVDCSCIEIEQDGKLGRDQIERQRAEVGQLAMRAVDELRG
jgi:hypothetical protein